MNFPILITGSEGFLGSNLARKLEIYINMILSALQKEHLQKTTVIGMNLEIYVIQVFQTI